MSDLTPEDERKIVFALLGEENFQRFERSQEQKRPFKPELSKKEVNIEVVFRKKAAEVYPYIDPVFGERWRVNIWNGCKFVFYKDKLTSAQADSARHYLEAKGYHVDWAMVERGYMIEQQMKADRLKNLNAPSRKKSIMNEISKIKI